MSEKLDRKERAALLKRIRTARGDLLRTALEERKAMQAVRKRIEKALSDQPLTVPTIAEVAEVPTDDVLWHVTAMKKYGRVAEDEQDGDWFKYRLVDGKEEEKKE